MPATLQTALKEHTKGAAIVGLFTRKEKGKTMYEVENKTNGRGADPEARWQRHGIQSGEGDCPPDCYGAVIRSKLGKSAGLTCRSVPDVAPAPIRITVPG